MSRTVPMLSVALACCIVAPALATDPDAFPVETPVIPRCTSQLVTNPSHHVTGGCYGSLSLWTPPPGGSGKTLETQGVELAPYTAAKYGMSHVLASVDHGGGTVVVWISGSVHRSLANDFRMGPRSGDRMPMEHVVPERESDRMVWENLHVTALDASLHERWTSTFGLRFGATVTPDFLGLVGVSHLPTVRLRAHEGGVRVDYFTGSQGRRLELGDDGTVRRKVEVDMLAGRAGFLGDDQVVGWGVRLLEQKGKNIEHVLTRYVLE